MVSERNRQMAGELRRQIDSSGLVGIIDVHKLPARNLFEIKNKLRPGAAIRVVKKRVLQLVLKESKKREMPTLSGFMKGSPALIFSSGNPFSLARKISESKAPSPAKPGDIAPRDIVVKAGPTALPAGPAIGDLQRAKIPAAVQEGRIAVKSDTVVAREGDEISPVVAEVLSRLGIHPMEVGLDLAAVWEDGTVYPKGVLFVPPEKYLTDLREAHSMAFSLALHIGYYTPENIVLFLSRARAQARGLALEAGFPTGDTVVPLLSRARSRMEALSSRLAVKEMADKADEKGRGEAP